MKQKRKKYSQSKGTEQSDGNDSKPRHYMDRNDPANERSEKEIRSEELMTLVSEQLDTKFNAMKAELKKHVKQQLQAKGSKQCP